MSDASFKPTMQPEEKRAAFAVAGVFSTRMLGLFMIFPVFALFAQQDFKDVTATQVGIAIGIYGLTQAFLQIPYGMLSDRFGRKPLIIAGMLVFAIGSMICATADSIEMMIVGRAIQGMGAVAAVLMATVADLVSEQFRLRAMSIVGMTIGLSFTVSLVAGPVLAEWIGVRGIFWTIALLAGLGILLTIFAIPEIKRQHFQREAEADPKQFKEVLKDKELLRLDFGVFTLHATLTAMFVALPIMIRDYAGMDSLHHWELYLPVMILSFVLMVPFIIQAETKGRMKQIYLGAIATIVVAQLLFMTFHSGFWSFFFVFLIFFTAFNLLEASLPSLVVKMAPADKKGTASGIYSTSQFLGAALGGALGGYFYQHYGYNGLFIMTATLGLIWLLFAKGMQNPLPLSIASVPLHYAQNVQDRAQLQQTLLDVDGVHQVVIVPEDERIYFKIDRKKVNEVDLIEFLKKVA